MRQLQRFKKLENVAFVHPIGDIGKEQMGVRFLAHKIGADGSVTTAPTLS
ncbi:hypothetical protein [Novibacillus thermophilus]|nr:hypothetical protein [Novibacillus thermophilus]